ncbi:Protein YicC [Chitinispirillum alkaliphilum]|nr:Protein YicC [Chitinispirillum alkaliphilum]
MPMRSMTGFGLAEQNTPSGTYKVEIRGVNNRFLELQVRQPKFASNLEQKIKKEVSSFISRGSVTVLISCDRDAQTSQLTWDKEKTENYVNIFREVKKQFSLAGDIEIKDLLQFSDLIKTESLVYSDETIWKHLKPVIKNALEAFELTRKTEGEFIAKDLKKILKEITKTIQKIEKRAPERVSHYSENLNSRIESMLETQVDPQRIATEVAIIADKIDISEECIRLRAHVAKFTDDFKLDEPTGKRMGFLLQEMNREANTIGSKANDTEISHMSVSLKENIEKIREQIQNIE